MKRYLKAILLGALAIAIAAASDRAHAAAGDSVSMSESFPLLPVVFFDSASAALPHRYQILAHDSSTRSFDERDLPSDRLAQARAVLNIIGSRLRVNPRASIEIIGYASRIRSP